MGDLGGIGKTTKASFPSIRRSTDITQPEAAETVFLQEVDEYLKGRENSVKETEEAVNREIDPDAEKERDWKEEKRKKQEEEEEEIEEEGIFFDSGNSIDIKV